MTDAVSETQAIADQVRSALDADDLSAFADLLDPNVRWGAPGDPSPSCQTRKQVLDWYSRGRAAGQRARVLGVLTHDDKVLVSTKVTSDQGEVDRWQVLTVSGGRVVDIRGYDDQAQAESAAGL